MHYILSNYAFHKSEYFVLIILSIILINIKLKHRKSLTNKIIKIYK